MERPATEPVMVPSSATVAAVFSQLCVLSETYASTVLGVVAPVPGPAPEILMATLAADAPELMATTAMLPSTFRNAAVLTPPPLDPTRIAPGRTNRDQFANAQSRFATSYVFVLLSTLMSFSLVLL